MRTASAFSLTAEPRQWRNLFLALLVVVPLVYAANTALIFDDPGLYEHFEQLLRAEGFGKTLIILFFNWDLHEGFSEYRTYGLSKVLHFLFWLGAGRSPAIYSAWIGFSQVASAGFCYALMRRLDCGNVQALLVSLVWLASPFAVTTCFHHYSYLLLPVQATLLAAYGLQVRIAHGQGAGAATLVALAAAASSISLMGEPHIPLTIVLLVGLAFNSPLARGQKAALAMTVVLSVVATLYLHHRGWAIYGAADASRRFNLGVPDASILIARTAGFWSSIIPGISEQIQQILAFKTSAAVGCAAAFFAALWALGKLTESRAGDDKASSDTPNAAGRSVLWPCCIWGALVLSSLAMPWMLWLIGASNGESLPRRYGYVPNTVLLMATVALLAAPGSRARGTTTPALAVVSAVIGLYVALVAVCLPQVRNQDAQLWSKVADALRKSGTTSIVFANAWNPRLATDYFSAQAPPPGLRGPNFPILFESPLMSFWWQSLYARSALGVAVAADGYQSLAPGAVQLTGMVHGLHFVRTDPIAVDPASVLVAFDPRIERPDWTDGPAPVELMPLEGFSAGASASVEVERGWRAHGFNFTRDTVAIDLGGTPADAATSASLADKRWDASASLVGPVSRYGLEFGEDRVFRREPLPRDRRAYYATNRHGDFVYRLDFSDRNPKVIAMDFLDIWSHHRNARVLTLDIEFDDRWVTLGQIDTFSPSYDDPVTVRFSSGNAKTIRIRLRKSFPVSDIPFMSGIRITPLDNQIRSPIDIP